MSAIRSSGKRTATTRSRSKIGSLALRRSIGDVRVLTVTGAPTTETSAKRRRDTEERLGGDEDRDRVSLSRDILSEVSRYASDLTGRIDRTTTRLKARLDATEALFTDV